MNELTFFEPYSLWYYPWWQHWIVRSIVYYGSLSVAAVCVILLIKKVWELRNKSYWKKAYEQLALLGKRNLLDEDAAKKVYSDITAIMKNYLSRRYHKDYTSLTDREAIDTLEYEQLTNEQKEYLSGLFLRSDPVKFARQGALESQIKSDLARALDFVKQTKPS